MSGILDLTVKNAISQRKSIRKFLDKPVERDKILSCLESARLAPSAENAQPWRFIVIDEPELKKKFSSAAFSGVYKMTRWAANAPVLIVICAKLDIIANRIGKQIQGTNYYLIDVGIAGEHIALQAVEEGLGTCWIGWFNAKKSRKVLNIPRSFRVVAVLALGYPDPAYKREKEKLPLEQIAWFNGYKKGK